MKQLRKGVPVLFVVLAVALAVTRGRAQGPEDPNLQPFPNASGASQTFNAAGFIDTRNPFFQDLGTNGRACVTCHQPGEGWSITPAGVQARFRATNGTDPIFRTNDGSNAPNLDVSTVAARRKAYSLLLSRGLIRVGLPIPPNAEFSLAKVEDPYRFASARELSLFRRPLPSTNLRFLSAVMWDGRESKPGRSLHENLMAQSDGATAGHAEAASKLTYEQQQQIVEFEMALHTAQVIDATAGPLLADGAWGGPRHLSQQEFFLGINDPLGLNPTGQPFNPEAFTLFQAWANSLNLFDHLVGGRRPSLGFAGQMYAEREAISRGEQIFNKRPINISGVSGLNDELGIPSIGGFCTTCHSSPNVGNHSVSAPLNIGIADASRRTPDMPLYTLRHKVTGQTVQTTDPGRALVTGQWKDIGRFKGPVLRALAARAPYFHDGSAATLDDVVGFYDTRFRMRLSRREGAVLVGLMR
jgi:hypothetical protein